MKKTAWNVPFFLLVWPKNQPAALEYKTAGFSENREEKTLTSYKSFKLVEPAKT
ncbi:MULTISPECIES: hypothetical protein [Acetobacter]|uniref:hypothetical protein n=1 Tax=Acetobacter TaxID=434 RepID=UPI0013C2FC91|nr:MULTISPECIES: hypothetical protein [Acetobacter]